MPNFICAVSTDASGNPAAYALVEQAPLETPSAQVRPSYVVRRLTRFDGDDPVEALKNLLAREDRLTGQVTLVVTGGQKVADRFHAGGISAVPVELGAGSRYGDTIPVDEQTVVDTFEAAYRRRMVEVEDGIDHISDALAALYAAMSDEAGAEDASDEIEALAEEEATGDETTIVPEDGPKPDVPEQSGDASALGAARVGGDERRQDTNPMTTAEDQPERRGIVEHRAGNAGAAVDLGEHRDVALALALACWYGEYAADELPATDQADEVGRVGRIRTKRQQAAQARQGQR